MADALSRISEECLSDEEAERMLEAVPVIPGDNTVFKVFEEKEEDWQPEKATPHTMSSITCLQELAGGQSKNITPTLPLIAKLTPLR